MHFVDNYKLQMNFEVVALHIGLDDYQNPEVIIVKKKGCNHPSRNTSSQIRKWTQHCSQLLHSILECWKKGPTNAG